MGRLLAQLARRSTAGATLNAAGVRLRTNVSASPRRTSIASRRLLTIAPITWINASLRALALLALPTRFADGAKSKAAALTTTVNAVARFKFRLALAVLPARPTQHSSRAANVAARGARACWGPLASVAINATIRCAKDRSRYRRLRVQRHRSWSRSWSLSPPHLLYFSRSSYGFRL